MNYQCATSQAEINHDQTQAQLAVEQFATAKEQLAQVNNLAKGFLTGQKFVDIRKVGAVVDGIQRQVQITYSMKDVSEAAGAELSAQNCYELMRGTPKALFDMQRLIGEAAHTVAFDALNLWSEPYADLNELREAAELGE